MMVTGVVKVVLVLLLVHFYAKVTNAAQSNNSVVATRYLSIITYNSDEVCSCSGRNEDMVIKLDFALDSCFSYDYNNGHNHSFYYSTFLLHRLSSKFSVSYDSTSKTYQFYQDFYYDPSCQDLDNSNLLIDSFESGKCNIYNKIFFKFFPISLDVFPLITCATVSLTEFPPIHPNNVGVIRNLYGSEDDCLNTQSVVSSMWVSGLQCFLVGNSTSLFSIFIDRYYYGFNLNSQPIYAKVSCIKNGVYYVAFHNDSTCSPDQFWKYVTVYTNKWCSVPAEHFYANAACFLGDFKSVSKFGCFPGKSTIGTLQSSNSLVFARKRIEDVMVGDVVISPAVDNSAQKPKSANVIAVLSHDSQAALGYFIELHTRGGATLQLTPNHLLPSGPCDTLTAEKLFLFLKPARNVEPGECVLDSSGNVTIVTTVWLAVERGLYTIVTTDPYIAVNDITVSPFERNHLIANSYYAIFRYAFMTFPSVYLKYSVLINRLHESLNKLLNLIEIRRSCTNNVEDEISTICHYNK